MDENSQLSDAATRDAKKMFLGIDRGAADVRNVRRNRIMREMKTTRYDDLPDVLTPKDVQAFLRLGRNAIYAALQDGRIRSVRYGQKFLIPKTAVREFLDRDGEHLRAGIPVKGMP